MVAVRYHAEVLREGTAWIASVTNADGAHTYSRTLRGLRHEVEESIRAAEDLTDEVELDVEYDFLNTDEEIRAAVAVGEKRAELDHEKQLLLVEGLVRAQKLIERGMSVRDVADLIGVSPGRVSQILSSDRQKRAG